MSTIQALALEHPRNPIRETGYQTQSKKSWVSDHPPINMKRTSVCTWQVENHDTQATFEPQLQPAMIDDEYRFALPAYPPNARSWRFHSESDVANWFHHEIYNVVLRPSNTIRRSYRSPRPGH